MDAAFDLLDLNGNGFVELKEVSMLLARVQQPAFGLFDRAGPTCYLLLTPYY